MPKPVTLSGVTQMEKWLVPKFISALQDYAYLIDKGYPYKGALKLVGDHHRLTRTQRHVLLRGITGQKEACQRRSLLLDLSKLNGQVKTTEPNRLELKLGEKETPFILLIDGHNVLYTLVHYRKGKPFFIATDGLLRDIGSYKARYKADGVWTDCTRTMIDHIFHLIARTPDRLSAIHIFLDHLLTYSHDHAALLRRVIAEKNQTPHTPRTQSLIKINVTHHADNRIVEEYRHIKKRHAEQIILSTSDSQIIDRCSCSVYDLAREILAKQYKANFIYLDKIRQT